MMPASHVGIACGVDVVDVGTFGRALHATRGRLAFACFTHRERTQIGGRLDRGAARWAVKEAVAKALGAGLMQGVGLQDVEVMSSTNGRVDVALRGDAERLAAARGLTDWAISISHECGIAVALVVAVGASNDRWITE